MVPEAYPREVKLLLYQYYHKEELQMSEAVEKVYEKYPKLRKRLTAERAYPVLSQFLARAAKKGEVVQGSKAVDRTPWASLSQGDKEAVFRAALALRARNYRWSAVVDSVQEQFPRYAIPTPTNLARISGHWVRTKEILPPAESREEAASTEVANCVLTITNGGTTQFTKQLTKGQVKQLIAQLWE